MKLYTKEELKDARIFFDKTPPRFMSLFIIFLSLFIVLTIFAAQMIKKPYVVKAQGVVAVEGASYVASKGHGVITEIYAKPGDYVHEGDLLIVISSGNEGLQASIVQQQIEDLFDTLKIMDVYEQALLTEENTLSNTGKELEYYGKVEYYLDLVKREKNEEKKSTDKLTEKRKEFKQLNEEMKKIEQELKTLAAKENTYSSEKSQLDDRLLEKYSEKEMILKELERLEEEKLEQEKLEQETPNEHVQAEINEKITELETIEKEIVSFESTLSDLEDNTNFNRQAELENDLVVKQSEQKGFTEEIKQLEQEIDNPFAQRAQTLNQLLSELGQSKNQINAKLTELQANLEASEEQDAIHFLTATQSGELHYVMPIATGMSIQQNQILAEIASNEEGIYIDTYISASDRSRVDVGRNVKVSIMGVNNYRFGSLSGVVDFIEPGTLQNESDDGSIVYYRAKVQLNETSLASKSGEVIELIRSMPVEARVVYEEESYLDWALNLLNLKNN
jgi:multidrug efflux pump subunit AcrA (membrane-fusion protein)